MLVAESKPATRRLAPLAPLRESQRETLLLTLYGWFALPADIQVFTCGPLPFMRHVRSSLMARGVPASSIRYEVFGPDLWAAQVAA